jgi:hypothetical protein
MSTGKGYPEDLHKVNLPPQKTTTADKMLLNGAGALLTTWGKPDDLLTAPIPG